MKPEHNRPGRNAKKTLAYFISSLLCSQIFGQVTTFKISDYIYRAPLYRSLQSDVFLDQSTARRSDKITSDRTNHFSYTFEGSIDQNETIATDTRLRRSSWYGYLLLSGNRSNQNGTKTGQSTQAPGLSYSLEERKYFSSNFIEYGGSAGGHLFSRKNTSQGKPATHRETYASLSPYAGLGRGRLEYVQDAQTALYILNDLYREGMITTVSADVANELARVISLMKRTRKIDQRRRAIYQLTTIDSFLTAKKIIAHCDAKTSAIINDNLFYGFTNDLSGRDYTYTPDVAHPMDFTRYRIDEGEQDEFGWMPFLEPVSDQMFRRHGTIMYARLTPSIKYSDYREKIGDSVLNTGFITDNLFYAVPTMELVFEKHNAMNLKFQKNVIAGLRAEHNMGKRIVRTSYLSLFGNYVLGYYPNNRTVIEGDAGMQFSLISMRNYKTKSYFVAPGLSVHTGYFVSYNTVLRGSFSLRYGKFFGSDKSSDVQQLLTISLRHYFY